jgi:hypothetical protein
MRLCRVGMVDPQQKMFLLSYNTDNKSPKLAQSFTTQPSTHQSSKLLQVMVKNSSKEFDQRPFSDVKIYNNIMSKPYYAQTEGVTFYKGTQKAILKPYFLNSNDKSISITSDLPWKEGKKVNFENNGINSNELTRKASILRSSQTETKFQYLKTDGNPQTNTTQHFSEANYPFTNTHLRSRSISELPTNSSQIRDPPHLSSDIMDRKVSVSVSTEIPAGYFKQYLNSKEICNEFVNNFRNKDEKSISSNILYSKPSHFPLENPVWKVEKGYHLRSVSSIQQKENQKGVKNNPLMTHFGEQFNNIEQNCRPFADIGAINRTLVSKIDPQASIGCNEPTNSSLSGPKTRFLGQNSFKIEKNEGHDEVILKEWRNQQALNACTSTQYVQNDFRSARKVGDYQPLLQSTSNLKTYSQIQKNQESPSVSCSKYSRYYSSRDSSQDQGKTFSSLIPQSINLNYSDQKVFQDSTKNFHLFNLGSNQPQEVNPILKHPQSSEFILRNKHIH